jgi:hypothetical protein
MIWSGQRTVRFSPGSSLNIRVATTTIRVEYRSNRRDPKKGYVRGNVIVVSLRANKLRNDGEPDELARVARYYFYKLYDEFDAHVEAIETENRYGALDDDMFVEDK